MSLFIASINSGSNGNCYYIGNETEAVLIDAGISCRETEKRMRQLGLSMHKVKAIFISHEHSDHIKAVDVLAEKYNLPVHITHKTLQSGGSRLKKQLVNSFKAYEPVLIGGLAITAFPKFHDAVDPHCFIVKYNMVTVGVFTDIGASCDHVVKHFSLCHAAFLETNYDETLLENGRYPAHLKNRIRSGNGHLSNTQALEIFRKHKPPFMSHLLLSHLSKDNNRPELVKKLFEDHADGTEIIVASRYEATAVYHIHGPEISGINHVTAIANTRMKQMSLF
jgi:phosphoribosyl 1,2-cyclic phosphodiesterase